MATIRLIQNKINPLVLPVILADKLAIFEKYQVPVALEIAETFRFGSENPFVAGKVEGMMGDLTFFFDYLKQGKEAIITSNLTRTIQLLIKKDLPKSHANLKIGVARKGLFPFFMAHDLQAILPNPEIVWIDNTYDRIEALAKGEIDGLVAIEPFIHDILQDYPTEVLWHSKNSDKNMVMWCFDRTFYEEHPELVRNFHLALAEAQNIFNQADSQERLRLCQEIAGYTSEAAKAMLDFQFEQPGNYQARDFQLLADFLYEQGQLAQPLQAKDYLAKIY